MMLAMTPRERLRFLYETASSLALEQIDAVFRTDSRRLRPSKSHLATAGHKLFSTSLGIVDVLGALGNSSYEDLLPDAVELTAEGMTFRVLSLERLIEAERLRRQLQKQSDGLHAK